MKIIKVCRKCGKISFVEKKDLCNKCQELAKPTRVSGINYQTYTSSNNSHENRMDLGDNEGNYDL